MYALLKSVLNVRRSTGNVILFTGLICAACHVCDRSRLLPLRRVLMLVEIRTQDEACFCRCTVQTFVNAAIPLHMRRCGSLFQWICSVTCDVKLCLCAQWGHMGLWEVYLHAFLISQVDGGVDNFTRRPFYLRRTGCVDPGVGLDGFENRRD